MNRIKKLSSNLINQVAAGEVIERPCSVVKELVENSIDAGASRIEITISNACRNIRIADNGSGIYPDDIQLAFTNHATSKLQSENELFNIHTLGFRGEALSSIVSISNVTCITRTKDFDYGIKVEYQNENTKSGKIGCNIGTIMQVNDLFYNQPARLKFLKSEKTEFAYIQELVQSLAIAHPSIAFILKNNSNIIINTTCNSDLLSRITQIYSNSITNELKEVNKTDKLSNLSISGYISSPDYTRSSKKSIYTFVNSRIIKCPVLLKAVDSAYKNLLPIGRYPFVVLNLKINSDEIDVNVHPQKQEIRYKNTNQIFNFVQSAVDFSLSSLNSKNDFIQTENKSSNIVPFSISFNINEEQNQKNVPAPFEFPVKKFKSDNNIKTENPIQKKMEIKFAHDAKLNNINVIGQLNNTYILVENENNLEIIDQHIAQERYIYEKLKNQKEAVSQLLIISDVINAEPTDIELLENAQYQLEKFGYKIEKISDTKIMFKKIPQILLNVKMQDLLSELLTNLKNSTDNALDTIEEKILRTTSCKASVKAGDKLTLWQMEEIVRNLRTTKNQETCPHGRPISHYISLKDISSFFNRT